MAIHLSLSLCLSLSIATIHQVPPFKVSHVEPVEPLFQARALCPLELAVLWYIAILCSLRLHQVLDS